MNWGDVANDISNWIGEYAKENGIGTLVVGVSGGIDSAVTSTLSAMTGIDTIVLNMPIHQDGGQYDLSERHIEWLKTNWENVGGEVFDLSSTYDQFCSEMGPELSELSLANSRARLRMTALYAIAGSYDGMVVGTGNKVEDFGVGFFTKYGDGGVDISPIADLYKSEVFAIGKELGIIEEILEATPTDGLWDDGRTDEEQIGASYEELEWAMRELENPSDSEMTDREQEVMDLYTELHEANSHKMVPIPVFKVNSSDRGN
ncbi:MAG: NAD(+) synthase [Candidatus Thermoplasmatota archaeon]|jgi:NAD+ synthase|nr:NAD(+) synthase [Candidatus Thermoplasmatota archaeon]|tara:strand:- start:2590 stop:3369 length:780 start_codon:yes stop_codon:yes gene_type:complete